MTDELDGWESIESGWVRKYKGLQLNILDLGEHESWLVTVTGGDAERATDAQVSGPATVAADVAVQLADELSGS